MSDLRAATIQLAQANPELRPVLLPLLKKEAAGGLDPMKHRISKREMSINEAIRRFDAKLPSGMLNPVKASELIENVILQAPIYPLIAQYTRDGRELLVDGAWRLGVFASFIEGKFAYTTADGYFPNFEGMTFAQLPNQVKRRITEFNLTVIFLELTMSQEMVDRYVRQVGHPRE